MNKMSILYKLSFSSLLIALFIVLSRFLAIPSLFGIPFIKVSIASSVVAFASFYLGPVFGLLVGTFGDVIAALVFPQGEFNPLFTIASSLGGLMPFIIYKILYMTKIEKKYPIILGLILLTISIGLTVFIGMNDSIRNDYSSKEYILYPRLKATLISIVWVMSILLFIGVIVIGYKFKNSKLNRYYSVSLIATSLFFTYYMFKIPISSAVFMYVYSFDFTVVFAMRCLKGIFNVFVDTLLTIIALNVSLKFGIKGALIDRTKLLKEEE